MFFATRSERSSPRRPKNTSVLTPRHRARARHDIDATYISRSSSSSASSSITAGSRAPPAPRSTRQRRCGCAAIRASVTTGKPDSAASFAGGYPALLSTTRCWAVLRALTRRFTTPLRSAWRVAYHSRSYAVEPFGTSGTCTRGGSRRGHARPARGRSAACGAYRSCRSDDGRRRCCSIDPQRARRSLVAPRWQSLKPRLAGSLAFSAEARPSEAL